MEEKQSIWRWIAKPRNLAIVIGVAMSLFHIYTGVFGALDALQQRSLHYTFVLLLVFILYPAIKQKERKIPVYDWVCIALSLIVALYPFYNYTYLTYIRVQYVTPVLPIEEIFAGIIILLTLEAARRAVGWFIAALTAVFMLAVFLGRFLPPPFYNPNITVGYFTEVMYLTQSGLWGLPIGLSATYIVLMIIFGAFMQQTGFGEFVTDVAAGVTGRYRGGPAKVAVLSSALFGTISGSGSANVAMVGVYTIPMMKSIGFKPHFAAAVEAAASTGGQIMPPIMAAAAFLLAAYVGIPYSSVIAHAAIPAVLYFASCYFMIDLEAAKTGMRGLTKEELPDWKAKFLIYGPLIIPIIILLYFLFIGRSVFFAVTVSIFATIALSYARKKTFLWPRAIVKALSEGAKGTVIVAVACAVAGLMIGAIYMTGIGGRFTAIVANLSGGNIFIALLITMIAALILGMGMPTTAAYVLMVALIIPALTKLGVAPLSAHMFAFYFACLSLITPPVATTAYVAAGIAGAPMMKTGFTAARLAAASFIVPFMFVYGPALLGIGSPLAIVIAVIAALIGVWALAMSLQGWGFIGALNVIQRIMAFGAAICLIFPEYITDIVGILILAIIFFWERARRQRRARLASA